MNTVKNATDFEAEFKYFKPVAEGKEFTSVDIPRNDAVTVAIVQGELVSATINGITETIWYPPAYTNILLTREMGGAVKITLI